MGAKLSGPVGKGVVSSFADAVTVQLLLNLHIGFDARLHKWLKPFPSDGVVNGSNPADPTVTAITIFQREVVGFQKPDGRVDPGGKTFKALTGQIGSPVKPAPSTGASAPAVETSDPVPLKKEVHRIRFGGSQRVTTGLGSFEVAAGKLFKAVDGDRLVTAVIAGEVVYALMRSNSSAVKTGVYSQVLTGFVNDVTIGSAAADIVSSTQVIRQAILIEMYLLCGVAIGISAPAALFHFASTVGQWTAENEKHFPKWRRQGRAILEARESIKRCAPTLYDELYVHVLKNFALNIPSAFASDEKLVALIVGEWMGRLGKGGFTGAFSLAGKLVAILWPALKAAVLSTPDAASRTGEQLVDELEKTLRQGGRNVSRKKAEKIREEVLANRAELLTSFQKLHEAFRE